MGAMQGEAFRAEGAPQAAAGRDLRRDRPRVGLLLFDQP